MLRAGSVEILFPTRVILETMKDCLLIYELAIQQELTELHDVRADMDYRFDDESTGKDLGELIKDNQEMLVAVRSALEWLSHAAPVFLSGETIDNE